jgi:Nickel-dependent hydrogenase/NADH ubiquinone oxidoreductase, 20 Kd subunit
MGNTIWESLQKKGYNRRQFLQFCGVAAAVAGLEHTAVAQVAAAFERKERPAVLWMHLQECTGCSESFIRASHPIVADALLDVIDLTYDESLMAPSGCQAEKSLADTMRDQKGKYIVLVEGAVPTKDKGVYCMYSFLKTPRWKENPMEVGPLSRLLVSYGAGHTDVKELIGMVPGKLNVPVDVLFSTLGRNAARGIDAALTMVWLKQFFGELMDRVKTREVSTFNEKWEPKTWPWSAKASASSKPRAAPSPTGSRSRTARSTNYQPVVPTTWNG